MSAGETNSLSEGPEDSLCKKCGLDPIDRSESLYSSLCKPCREQHIKFPFPLGIKLFFGVLLLAAIVSVARFSYIAQDYATVSMADRAYELGNHTTAFRLYQTLYEKQRPASDKLGRKLFQTAVLVFDYDLAGDLYSEHLYGHKVSDEEYRQLRPLIDSMIQYYEDSSFFAELELAEDASYEDFLSALHSIPEEERNPLVKYLLLSDVLAQGDFAAAAAYLESLLSEDTMEYIDIFPQLASCYRHLEQYDTARAYAGQALARNRENPEAIRQLAVIEVLFQNYDDAVREAERAFALAPDGQYIADTLALSYYLAQDTEGLARVAAYAETHGLILDSYQDVASGVKTVRDIYLGGL